MTHPLAVKLILIASSTVAVPVVTTQVFHWDTLITAGLTAIPSLMAVINLIITLRVHKDVGTVKHEMNAMKDELVISTREAGRGEGIALERQRQEEKEKK